MMHRNLPTMAVVPVMTVVLAMTFVLAITEVLAMTEVLAVPAQRVSLQPPLLLVLNCQVGCRTQQ
jgi:hypothetical protein